jgi:chromate transport protein ChrA
MTWLEALSVFLRAAFLSVNGSTTLALLQQDLVGRLGILTPAEFSLGVSVGAASPGPLGYGCIALGYLADGWRGALLAMFTSWLRVRSTFVAVGRNSGSRSALMRRNCSQPAGVLAGRQR